ncbi:toxin RTX-I translocation ATP-binding protein [Rhodoferax lithotrophicus]|uniref:Toxin RTX-I translocation ATP-binding protein n=1 Tax=Rhodoferax lithotrophicus TaxID=2798804 RepID=A0ABM7MJA7_9BURK|nr:peptidase domain-containing ABC transporter [Rhodoferax sp. MIZ03]BCO26313.1 toxin RTX-I translocation ATP-binding protein [Rhodoferax sp. MIZ03]
MYPILQSESSECALASLAMVANAHGLQLDLFDLRRRFPVSLKGATLQQLISHAGALNFSSRPLRLEIDELAQLALPCILHWDLNHFVVLKKVGRGHVTLLDPAVGERRLPLAEVSRHFTGVALELTPNAAFQPADQRQRVALSALTGKVRGLKRSLLQIFAVAVVLELFAIAAPLLNQLVVDDAIATHDVDLLSVLIIGFALLLVIQTAVGLARSWMVLVLGQSLSLQWASNVFAHLVKLPVEYFEKRHLGDVVSCFGSVGSIQKTLTTSVIEAVLDGIMGVAALGMMLLYSLKLSAVVVGSVLIYGVLRWVAYRPFRDAAAERLVVAARENTHFLETLRAITPLKLFGREQERRARWQNLLVEVQNRDVRTAKMNIGFSTAHTFVSGAENLLVFWLGAGLVMQSGTAVAGATTGAAQVFTIGMLFAFISYKGQFSSRVSALINYAVEIKMLSLHAERLGDIVLSTPEANELPSNDLAHLEPSVELKGVSFRYGEGEPWILKEANLRLEAGQSVAIIGPSGCGKTTLLKLLLGLLTPQEGDVMYGGIPVKHLGVQNYRQRIGTVMQEDVLLAGSIGDNISFFDVQANDEHTQACAQVAAVHEDIARMPMGYQTLVGDMGSSLSGGQKQRVLLARALYKNPKVLALDEATSHLDIANEHRVTQALAQLPLTRIIVAHRPETIAGVQRVVSLQQGLVHEVVRM